MVVEMELHLRVVGVLQCTNARALPDVQAVDQLAHEVELQLEVLAADAARRVDCEDDVSGETTG